MTLASKAEGEATLRLTGDDRRNIQHTQAIPWVFEAQLLPRWGFVLFRTSFGDDKKWKQFKETFTEVIEISLLCVPFSARIRRTRMLQYLEDEALAEATLSQLRDRFSNMCRPSAQDDVEEQGAQKIKQGLRRDAFLYADADAIASVIGCTLPNRGWVRAADPKFDATKPSLEHRNERFRGVVNIAITAVLTAFYARLDVDAPLPANPEKDECLRQNWELIWRKSRVFPAHYPPKLQFNK
ncbi:uncharacterized protein K452DRAFT_343942 [Aplosporella prunicola CBS 121167]|uniref:Uncharacterized protein n=1 Tax=Aplosporella prunicola CBS 121167 TaxID=1176127 RepID=A0A6A6BMD7_9PEZI|nr:uncharacterized protein K452DRAFT_343942 [Aplosporella prunicola CBS 121167]KAF2145300.1 hypothetical protein K452DRAFT_343942 [Aplosporella prunicola CBS 121167]